MTQDTALSILKTGANVCITGEPGSGKSYLIGQYIGYLREHGIEPAITASTGIAATHIGGMTIHSWSGLGIRDALTDYDLDFLTQKEKLVERARKTHVLIIDEISMLDAHTLGMIDTILRALRRNPAPFGGMQVIFVGDFFQLPPIARGGRASRFAFEAPSWSAAGLLTCYLSEQHRQEDPVFLDMLLSIRKGEVTKNLHKHLKARNIVPDNVDVMPQLFSHNADVDHINKGELSKIPGNARIFDMHTKGSKALADSLKRGCLSPETLFLKEGARVMFTKNDFENGFFNGTLGVVTGFAEDDGLPEVRIGTGETIKVFPMEWAVEEGGKTLAKIIQVPLRLAWAITIHKSQGMSLDAALMDLSATFEYGQGYVALSRVRSLAGLYLRGYNEKSLQVHPRILEHDAAFHDSSDQAREVFTAMSTPDLQDMHHNFIRACGGTIEKGTAKISKKKIPTHEATRELLMQKLTPREIAKTRGVTVGTVIEHLEKLLRKGLIDIEADCAHFKPSGARFEKICEAFEQIRSYSDTLQLAPARSMLGESYDFEELRLARLFLERG
ncbi:MAG: AAA family ATPase [Patescibacteria group bacterium]